VDQQQLVGTWKLCSFELRTHGGQTSFPFGRKASGLLIYSSDGYMSATLIAEERQLFRSMDIRLASIEEQAHAAATCLSYCGRYEMRADRVIHHVTASLFPNWVGQSQERFIQFDGVLLTLSTPTMQVQGVEQSGHLIWERTGNAP